MNTSDAAMALATTASTARPRLLPGEYTAVTALLACQRLLGQASPPFTAASVLELMTRLDALSAAYPKLVDPTFGDWARQLYELLAAVDTVYGQKFPALYLCWQVSRFPFDPSTETIHVPQLGAIAVSLAGAQSGNTWTASANSIQVGGQAHPVGVYGGVYAAFRNVCSINYAVTIDDIGLGFGNVVVAGAQRQPWVPTANPPAWNRALADLLQRWGEAGCPVNVFPHCTFDDYAQKHRAVLDPRAWTDVERLKAGVAALWQSQRGGLEALSTVPTLLGPDYFALLHLLIAVSNGDDDEVSLVVTTLQSPCSSPEYPNDTFANQLVYAALMHVADPTGAYRWNATRRLQLLQDLLALTQGSDPASAALQAALQSHLDVQNVDSAYPMQDPNNNVPFDQRLTDTLAALDKARVASSVSRASVRRDGAGLRS